MLKRAETPGSPAFLFDEVRRWPDGLLASLVEVGMLCELQPTDTVACEGCAGNHLLNVDVCHYPGRTVGMAKCPECGRVEVPLDRLRLWAFDLAGAARALACAIGASGEAAEDVPGRLIDVGRVVAAGTWRDLFLARGLAWDDVATALSDARRLKASGAPLVLALAELPRPPVWADCKPALALLSDAASFDNGLRVDLDAVLGRPTKPHPDAVGSEWLTVTEAANRLVEEDVVDGLKLARAKVDVSNAATRGHLASNGKKGKDRRIDLGSLAKWILELRWKNTEEYNKTHGAKRRSRRKQTSRGGAGAV